MRNTITWILLLLLAAAGIGGSYALSEAFRTDAREAWEAEASKVAQWLSGTVLGWLEESYAPLSGLAMLAGNSETLTEVEFLNGFDNLESRATAFFLDSAAYLRFKPDRALQLVFSTDIDGPLAAGTTGENLRVLIPTVKAAYAQPGRILLGPPFQLEAGTKVSTVALAISEPSGNLAVSGTGNGSASRLSECLRSPGGPAPMTATWPPEPP